jgi:hypothetical protein
LLSSTKKGGGARTTLATNVTGQLTPGTKEISQTPLLPAKTGIIKRLTLDLNEDLHRCIKLACTIRGSTMVEEIIKLLEKKFPPS